MTTKIIIVCSGPIFKPQDQWVNDALMEWYKPEFNRGEGKLQLTYDVRKAMLFDDLTRAYAYVERIPANRPLTEAGTPNRPIKCFKIVYRAIDIEATRRRLQEQGRL